MYWHKLHNRAPQKHKKYGSEGEKRTMKRHSPIEGRHVERSAWQVQQEDQEDSATFRGRRQGFCGVFFDCAAASYLKR